MRSRLQRSSCSAASLALALLALSGSTRHLWAGERPHDSLISHVPRGVAVQVVDEYSREIPGTNVLISSDDTVSFPCSYDPRTHLHRAIVPGDGIIAITALATGFESQTRTFRGSRLPWPLKIMLGRPGSAYVWINGVRVPYPGYPNEIAVMAHTGWDFERDSVETSGTNSTDENTGPLIHRTLVTYFVDRTSEKWMRTRSGFSYADDLSHLRTMPGVALAGRIFRKHEGGASIITDRVIVSFWPHTREHTALDILRLHSLRNASSMLGSPHSFVATVDPASRIDVDEILESLAVLPDVESVWHIITMPLRLD